MATSALEYETEATCVMKPLTLTMQGKGPVILLKSLVMSASN